MGRRARSARIATAQHAADRCDHFRHFVDDRLNESMQQFLPTVHRLAGGASVDDQDRQDSRVAGKLLDKGRLLFQNSLDLARQLRRLEFQLGLVSIAPSAAARNRKQDQAGPQSETAEVHAG